MGARPQSPTFPLSAERGHTTKTFIPKKRPQMNSIPIHAAGGPCATLVRALRRASNLYRPRANANLRYTYSCELAAPIKQFHGYLLHLWKCLPFQMCPLSAIFFPPKTFHSFAVSAWKPSLWDRPTICQSRGSLAREWSPLSFTGAVSEHTFPQRWPRTRHRAES